MSYRITNQDLKGLCDRLNRVTGNAETPWTRNADGHMTANVGNYHISGAYGGVCLHQMHNEHGGVTTPLGLGHRPKRQLYDQMHAYLSGFEAGAASAQK